MKEGVIIIALRKKAYSMAAFNLALSIKHHNPNINITLLSDGEHQKHYGPLQYSVFDWIKEIPESDYEYNNNFEPGLAKLNFLKHSPYDNTLYIDADSFCFKDLSTLLADLSAQPGFVYSNVMGSGGLNDDIHYSPWATNKQLWSFFDLKPEQKVYTVNTSWVFVKRCEQSEQLFKDMIGFFKGGFGKESLLHQWGGSMPDELFYVGAMAKHEIDPTYKEGVMFFGHVLDKRTLEQIQQDHYFFTLFGKGTGVTTVRTRYIEYYDRQMFKICSERGHEHYYKVGGIMQGKHLSK